MTNHTMLSVHTGLNEIRQDITSLLSPGAPLVGESTVPHFHRLTWHYLIRPELTLHNRAVRLQECVCHGKGTTRIRVCIRGRSVGERRSEQLASQEDVVLVVVVVPGSVCVRMCVSSEKTKLHAPSEVPFVSQDLEVP